MSNEMSPFIDKNPFPEGAPHCWIQWKGTTVCMDVHCKSGAHLQVCGEMFVYFLKCSYCSTVYNVSAYVALLEVDENLLEKYQITLAED